jgi:flagellar protein FlaJ
MLDNMNPERRVALISVGVALGFFLIFSILIQEISVIINIGIICLFIAVGPTFFYRYSRLMWLRTVEREFPNFIRDLANLKHTGMSLTEAVKMTAKTNYGKLTPEVKKFSNRLTWGTDFLRSLEIFDKRFVGSKIMHDAVDIIKQSYLSGSDIEVTLDSLSRDMVMLKDIEDERKSMVREHVMVMYGIFYMFMAITIAIIYVLIPMMTSQSDMMSGGGGAIALQFRDPCEISPFIFPCGYFSLMCSAFNVKAGIGCYYLALFLNIQIIQAIFMGLIAGQVGENSATAGAKHSFIMLASTFLIFTFLVQSHMMPI